MFLQARVTKLVRLRIEVLVAGHKLSFVIGTPNDPIEVAPGFNNTLLNERVK